MLQILNNNMIDEAFIMKAQLSSTNKISYSLELLKEQGNIKPSQLYNVIKFSNNKPDHLAIDIYSDLRSWYKPKKCTEVDGSIIYISKLKNGFFKTSYCYLAKKYQVSKETIRSKLVKLEELGLLNRAFSTENRFYNRKENNILNILVWKNTKHFISTVGLSKTEELVRLCYNKNVQIDLVPSPDTSGDIYSNTNNLTNLKEDILDNKSESNFMKNKLKDNKEEQFKLDYDSYFKNDSKIKISKTFNESMNASSKEIDRMVIITESSNFINRIAAKFSNNKSRFISEFYPVNEEDAQLLRTLSGRQFNLNYINKLIEKLGKDKVEHKFYNKDLFFKYMCKVLVHEIRQESVVNNQTFRFKQDPETEIKEKYLAQIEYNKSTDVISHLRKKIATIFDLDTAYKILTSCIFKGIKENKIFEIDIAKDLELSAYQNRLLLGELKSLLGNDVKIEFKTVITDVETKGGLSLSLGSPGTSWNIISTKLLNYYGEAVHKSWFSKLDTDENNSESKTLRLKAPNSFFKDWIISNYQLIIEKFCKEEGFQLSEISV